MKQHNNLKIGIFILLAFASAGFAEQANHQQIDVVGKYVLKNNPNTKMEIITDNNQHVVMLSGGGNSSTNGEVAADCFIRAIGKLNGNSLLADFSEIETDTISYSKEDAKSEGRKVQILFGLKDAKVVKADTFGYCGLGANLLGQYTRKSKK